MGEIIVPEERAERSGRAPMLDAPPAPAGSTPMEIVASAITRGIDADKLEKLIALQERYEANEARKAFTAAMADFKRDLPTIVKNKLVDFETRTKGRVRYRHATLDECVHKIAPALARCGFSHDWSVEQGEDKRIAVTCILTHAAGHSKSVTLKGPPDESGTKNALQATSSTITMLQRYTLLAITGLASADQDDDGAKGAPEPVETVTAEQAKRLDEMLDETDSDREKFRAWLEERCGRDVPTIDSIPADFFDEAMATLERKRQRDLLPEDDDIPL